MKTKTFSALALAFGILSTGAFADDTTVPSEPASNAKAATAPAPDLTAKQIAQLEHDFNAKYRANDGLAKDFSNQVLPGDRTMPIQAEFPTVVFSEPPSPAFYYDANAPAYWYPSVSFHFDWSRNRRG
jgi:hypothetical protein